MIRINQKNNTVTCLVMLLLALVALSGCDKIGKHAPATPTVQSPQPAAVPAKTPAAAVQKVISSAKLPPVQPNQFDFSTKKDPFKPFVAVKAATPSDLRKTRGLKDALPIHNFDVSQFKLIGIVADPKGNKAMVVDPNGKAYVVKPGMTIGKNEGKISQIAAGGVDVVEQFRDDNGKIRKETIRIPLLRKP